MLRGTGDKLNIATQFKVGWQRSIRSLPFHFPMTSLENAIKDLPKQRDKQVKRLWNEICEFVTWELAFFSSRI